MEIAYIQRYVTIAQMMAKLGIDVPKILACNQQDGLVLMTDLGDQLYLKLLNHRNVDQLYRQAMAVLLKLQGGKNLHLPAFDAAAMLIGLNGFQQVFLQAYLNCNLSVTSNKLLQACFKRLLDNALNQPQAAMHRDFHSENLLLLANGNTGVVDFQDAKIGPITYDLVSLLRDCYISWPNEKIQGLQNEFYYQLRDDKLLDARVSPQQFQQWFDWMGMKRHLKACYSFANKSVTDNDNSYLQHLPRALNYICNVGRHYRQFHDFVDFIEQDVMTKLAQSPGIHP